MRSRGRGMLPIGSVGMVNVTALPFDSVRPGWMYNHAMTSIRVRSHCREEIIDITPQVQRFVAASGHPSGLVAIYCPHTTAGISVNENADPDVKSDMVKFLGKLIPVSTEFRHAE